MSLIRGEINPLTLLEVRKLRFKPPHFRSICVSKQADILILDQWIMDNLRDRYCIQNKYKLIDNAATEVIEISFENEKELVLFGLGCQDLHAKI